MLHVQCFNTQKNSEVRIAVTIKGVEQRTKQQECVSYSAVQCGTKDEMNTVSKFNVMSSV